MNPTTVSVSVARACCPSKVGGSALKFSSLVNLNLPQVRGFFKGREGKVLTVYRRKFCIHVERVRFLISNLPNDMRHSSTGCYQLAFHFTSTSAQCVYAVYNLYLGPSTDVLHHFISMK